MMSTNPNKLNLSLPKFLFLISLLIIGTISKKAKKEKPVTYTSKVIEMNDETFENFNKTNKQFYVFFTGEKCKKCDKVNSKYEESSDLSSKTKWNIPHVRININKNPKLKEKYGIKRGPKFFFANYDENEFHEFSGRKTPKEFLKFIDHHLNYTTQEIHKWEDVTSKNKNGLYLIFLGDPERYNAIYKRVIKASRDEYIDFLMFTKSAELFDKFGINKNSFDAVLVERRSKKKGYEIKGNLRISENTSTAELEKIMEIFERKPYAKADDWNMLHAIESSAPTPSLFLVYNNKLKEQKELNKQISSTMENIARKHRRDYHFMNVTISSHLATPLISVFDLKKNNTPYLILVNDNKKYEDDVEKYILPKDVKITEENVEKFLNDFKENKLQKVLFSEKLNKTQTIEGVHNLQAQNYQDFLFKENLGKDVLLFLHSSLSYQNDQVLKRIKHTHAKLSGNSHLVFAMANPLLNEMPTFSFENMPTLFIIKGNSEKERRSNIKEFYLEKYNMKNFVEFVKEFSSSSVTEKTLDNELELIKEEETDEFEINKKDLEEDLIDYEVNNAGLRRYTKYTMDETDDEEDEKDDNASALYSEDEEEDNAVKDDL